jgi:hypothetical protein
MIFCQRGSCSLRKATGGHKKASGHRAQTHADPAQLSVSYPSLVGLLQASFLSLIVSQVACNFTLPSPEKVPRPPTPKSRPALCHYVQARMHLPDAITVEATARNRESIANKVSTHPPQYQFHAPYAERLQPAPTAASPTASGGCRTQTSARP